MTMDKLPDPVAWYHPVDLELSFGKLEPPFGGPWKPFYGTDCMEALIKERARADYNGQEWARAAEAVIAAIERAEKAEADLIKERERAADLELKTYVAEHNFASAVIQLTKAEAKAAALRELLKSIEFAASGYCPSCHGWEVTKGQGCQPKVHTKNCVLNAAIKEAK